MTISLFLIAYGITFGIQNKVTFLRGKHELLDKMLVCTYCAGFHGGWITWLLSQWFMIYLKWGNIGFVGSLSNITQMLEFSFASAAFCYALDTMIRLMESHAEPLEVPDNEEDSENV